MSMFPFKDPYATCPRLIMWASASVPSKSKFWSSVAFHNAIRLEDGWHGRLLGGPFRRWMGRDVKVHYSPPLMGQNQEHVQNLKANRWHGKEVNRDQLLDVVIKKRPPRLAGRLSAAGWAEKAIERREPAIIYFLLHPLAKALRQSPRWPTLAKMMNLPVSVS